MSKQHPIEIFMPPNVLKAKMGGSGGLDLGALKRAEQALEGLKDEFAGWIVTDVNHLSAAREAYAAARDAETLGALYRAAHDLRGQGKTFDFPLVARVAGSLCKLADEAGARLPMTLVDAHVDAIKVILRDRIKESGNRIATALAEELERQVASFLEKNAA